MGNLEHSVAVRLAHKSITQHADAHLRRIALSRRGGHGSETGTFSHCLFLLWLVMRDACYVKSCPRGETNRVARITHHVLFGKRGVKGHIRWVEIILAHDG